VKTIDPYLFVDIIETEGCQEAYSSSEFKMNMRAFLSVDGKSRVFIPLDNDITFSVGKGYLTQLGRLELLNLIFTESDES